MKSKLEVVFLASDNINGELPKNTVDGHRATKKSARRESSAPKIVVYPPMEETTSSTAAPRGGRLLQAISRRLRRRSNDADSDSSSSSSDSASENTRGDRSSCSASESNSDSSERQRRHHSTVSLRRVFQSLNLTSRSHSCSSTERARQPKKQQQPKRILRSPVTYTYVRGLSGLPTQRVPLHTVYCSSNGLNR